MASEKPNLKVLLAAPRGFCAGVDRAIQIVELALEKYGAPVYVRHEIVHNKFVVDSLREKGAVFVEELEEISPEHQKTRPVIFSAHGVPKAVPADAKNRNMHFIDATCPLVSKVHREAERHFKTGKQIILIGHAGHPEVIGTIGQLPDGAVILVETVEDVAKLQISCHPVGASETSLHKRDPENDKIEDFGDTGSPQFERSADRRGDDGGDNIVLDPENLAFCTQTTLSVDDTAAIVKALQERFPNMEGPRKEDICYATTNRQAAVKMIAEQSDAMIVIGAPNSSNSMRLVEVAALNGCPKSMLVQRAGDIDWGWMAGTNTLGVTAGASAPEVLIQEVIDKLGEHYEVTVQEIVLTEEDVEFKIPKELRAA